ncbi:MAG: glycosyltransferase family 4 protein, partial [Candidatus Aenigmatarchaeota archaeon]
MKIVFLSAFTFSNNIGGIESHIYFMAKALQKRGHEITIVQPIDSPDTEIKCQVEDNITIQFIPTKTPGLIRFLNQYNGVKLVGFVTAFLNKAKYFLYRKKIAQVVKRIAPDIVHQHDFISNIFTTKLLAKEFSCILTNHTGEYLFFQKSLIGRFLLKYLLRHYKYIIGPSTELTPFKYNKNSVTIHNGVDLSLFNVNNDRLELRLKYGIQPNRFVVLCPRRWAPTKGIL